MNAKATVEIRITDMYPEVGDDLQTGAALRKLQEELPKEWWYTVDFDLEDVPGSPFRVFVGGPDHSNTDPYCGAFGATLKEAVVEVTGKLGKMG